VFSFLKRHKELITVGFLLLFPFITFLTSGHKGRDPNYVDRAVLFATGLVSRPVTWICDGIGHGVSGYIALRHAKEGEQSCRDELAQANVQVTLLREQSAENERLRAFVRYAEQTPEEEIVARIIGVNPDPLSLSLRVNRGEDEGVHAGMPVLTSEGVIGRVKRATGGYSDVLLMTDLTSKIGVIDQRSRVRGTAAGAGGGKPLALENIVKTDDVEEGDLVVTSGTDGVFPKGLVIGRITAVQREPQGMMRTAGILPAVDTTRLEEAMVLPLILTPDLLPRKDGGARL
jgi:rod shape-determining protein MreC